ncbi:MAG: helix-turn-helix domain-containing protein [Caldilineaceae bacterium]
MMEKFGEKLQKLRQKHGVSLRELSTQLGYASHSYLTALEKNERKPSADVILKLADLFDVTTDQLMRDEFDLDEDDSAGQQEAGRQVKRIGEKLQMLRLRLGLTMIQLAEHLETSHAQISWIESGLRTPSSELLLKMSLFFEVSANRLLRDDLDLDE